MVIHTIGDSHSCQGWTGICEHHLGHVLCYSFGRETLGRCDIRKYNIHNGDTIVFSFGELDCRCHVHKYVNATTTYQQVIDPIVENYFKAIKLNVDVSKIKLKNVCVYNIVPPIQKDRTPENLEYPFIGTDEERKQYTLYFNQKIKELCIIYNYIFFDIYDKHIDENGFLRKEMSDGLVHITEKCFIYEFLRTRL